MTQEKDNYDINRATVEALTEKQLLERYGPNGAKALMDQQIKDGIAKTDPNLPSKRVFMAISEGRRGLGCFCFPFVDLAGKWVKGTVSASWLQQGFCWVWRLGQGKRFSTGEMKVDSSNASAIPEMMQLSLQRSSERFLGPRQASKRLSVAGAPSASVPATPLSSPATPASSNRTEHGQTQEDDQDPPKAKAKAKPKAKRGSKKKAEEGEEVVPLTPLQKAESLSVQILKKKTESDELALQMSTMPYGQGLHSELTKFTETFLHGPLLCFFSRACYLGTCTPRSASSSLLAATRKAAISPSFGILWQRRRITKIPTKRALA